MCNDIGKLNGKVQTRRSKLKCLQSPAERRGVRSPLLGARQLSLGSVSPDLSGFLKETKSGFKC